MRGSQHELSCKGMGVFEYVRRFICILSWPFERKGGRSSGVPISMSCPRASTPVEGELREDITMGMEYVRPSSALVLRQRVALSIYPSAILEIAEQVRPLLLTVILTDQVHWLYVPPPSSLEICCPGSSIHKVVVRTNPHPSIGIHRRSDTLRSFQFKTPVAKKIDGSTFGWCVDASSDPLCTAPTQS